MSEITEDIYKRIREIEFKSSRLANDLLAGAYRSAFKGKGMEFEEVRAYIPGDDVRSIDWNVTARMHHPYIKLYREERELTVMLIVDISASSQFGSAQMKSALIAEVGAVLAFSAMKNHDKVGLILFSDQIELYLPPKKGLRHILRMIRELLVFPSQRSGTDIGAALAFLGKVQRRSGICFVISDFLGSGYAHEMALAAKHHDLIAVAVTDPKERELPKLDWVEMGDLETGEVGMVNTGSQEVREQYAKAMEEQALKLQNHINRIGADIINLSTDKPYLASLRRFFQMRRLKR